MGNSSSSSLLENEWNLQIYNKSDYFTELIFHGLDSSFPFKVDGKTQSVQSFLSDEIEGGENDGGFYSKTNIEKKKDVNVQCFTNKNNNNNKISMVVQVNWWSDENKKRLMRVSHFCLLIRDCQLFLYPNFDFSSIDKKTAASLL